MTEIDNVIFKISRIFYRPIPIHYISIVNKFIENELNDDPDKCKKKLYDHFLSLGLDDIRFHCLNTFIFQTEKHDNYFLSCLILKIHRLEKACATNFNFSDLKWERYLNVSHNSSINYYSLNDTFLAVSFKNINKIYFYSYDVTGLLGTEYMKHRAKVGSGLGHITSTKFKDHCGFYLF